MINKGTPLFRSRSIVALFSLFVPWTLFCQTVNITVLVNTATVPDTIRSSAFVQMRGNRPPLTADSTSPVIFTRIAGDYWKATAAFAIHDTIDYAFFVNGHRDWHAGMEAPPLRRLIVGTKDSTLPLQYVFGSVKDTNQYWRPFAETDSIEILFRVNMEFQEDFRDEQRIAAVRGSFPSSQWEKSVFLKKEQPHAVPGSRGYEAGNFWSGMVRLPKPVVPIRIDYKFVQHISTDAPTASPLQWEDAIQTTCADKDVDGNRFFILRPEHSDTTLAFKYWRNNECPLMLQRDTIIVTFTANLTKAVTENTFVIGDSIMLVTGFRNTNTMLHQILMSKKDHFSYDYTAVDTLIFTENFKPQRIFYRYIQRDNAKEIHDRFLDHSQLFSDIRSYRTLQLTYSGKKQQRTVFDTSRSVYVNNRVPYFLKDRKLANTVSVLFTCDLRPPYAQISIGHDTIASFGSPFIITHRDSVYHYGVWINGIGFTSEGWIPWGEPLRSAPSRKMYDDGTHGDITPNDRVYSRTFQFHRESLMVNSTLKEYKYSINGENNETGSSISISHFSVVNDYASQWIITDAFGGQTPTLMDQWWYDEPRWIVVDVKPEPTNERFHFRLHQNFPNPFNPATSITFVLPQPGSPMARTTLTIYDLLGRTKATLVDGHLPAGEHSVQWNAQGQPSGVYIYRLTCGARSVSRRMLLLK